MKATRRQELKTNELAQTLEEIREFLRSYGNYVLMGLIVVGAVAVISLYVKRSASQALNSATREMNNLATATDDEARNAITVLERLSGEVKEDWFKLETMRSRAAIAMSRAHAAEDGTPSEEFLGFAAAAYQDIIESYPGRDLAVGVALCGLATIEEDRFILDGDPARQDAARDYLERVRDREGLNGTPIMSVALDRLNTLDETFVQVTLAEPPPPVVPKGSFAPMGTSRENPIPIEIGETMEFNPADLRKQVEEARGPQKEQDAGATEEPPADTEGPESRAAEPGEPAGSAESAESAESLPAGDS